MLSPTHFPYSPHAGCISSEGAKLNFTKRGLEAKQTQCFFLSEWWFAAGDGDQDKPQYYHYRHIPAIP